MGQTIGKYERITRNACENLTVFNTDKRLYSFGAGWIFSRSVPEPYRRRINAAIVEMRQTDTLHQLVQNGFGHLDQRKCSAKIVDVGLGDIGVLLLILAAPFLLLLVTMLILLCISKVLIVTERGDGELTMSFPEETIALLNDLNYEANYGSHISSKECWT